MSKILLTSVAFGALCAIQVSAATLTNGSLNGPVATASLPSGWSNTSGSPDTIDINNNVGCCSYGTATPSESSDGGTWVGFARDGTFNETFGQTITDLIIGTTYEISFESSNFGYQPLSYVATNAIEMFIDGTSIGQGADRAFNDSWLTETLSFTATAASQFLEIGLAYTDRSYMGIDGISIASVTAPIPLPASSLLLMGGMAALGWRAKRKV